jgi:hypothetical protein
MEDRYFKGPDASHPKRAITAAAQLPFNIPSVWTPTRSSVAACSSNEWWRVSGFAQTLIVSYRVRHKFTWVSIRRELPSICSVCGCYFIASGLEKSRSLLEMEKSACVISSPQPSFMHFKMEGAFPRKERREKLQVPHLCMQNMPSCRDIISLITKSEILKKMYLININQVNSLF